MTNLMIVPSGRLRIRWRRPQVRVTERTIYRSEAYCESTRSPPRVDRGLEVERWRVGIVAITDFAFRLQSGKPGGGVAVRRPLATKRLHRVGKLARRDMSAIRRLEHQ